MGMLTRPKLMLPFQIARIRNYFARRAGFARMKMSILSGERTRPREFGVRRHVAALKARTRPHSKELRRGFELCAWNAAQLKESQERFFDQIIRTGSARGDADHDRATRQPVFRDDFTFLVQVVMLDLIA